MAEVVVIRTQAVPSPNPARVHNLDFMVTYQVQPTGPIRSVRIEKDQPTAQEVTAAIKANEIHAATIDGQRLTI